MLKTVKDACTLHPTTLDYQVARGVDNLSEILDAEDSGKAFFEKSHITRGMEELLREGLLRISGENEQALFELSQSMGGGKTHLMCSLGLLAKYPCLRAEILPTDVINRLENTPARVAVFEGRNKPKHYLWGEIAKQLGPDAEAVMLPFWKNGPQAPGKEHWKKIIGDQPTLILFDELPPYFLGARTVAVGQGSMVDVLTEALSNLFAAALELPRCCVVLANLSDSYHDQVKEVRKLVADVQREASRQAKKITPVSLEGSEIYSILRKRLFAELPSDEDIDEVAEAYAEQIKLAEDSGYLTARSLEQVADEVRATYPFHPSFKHLVALFKDNPDFRETRGLLQFAARVIRSVWQRKQNDVFLIGTQHLDLNDSQVMNEVTDINRALRPAIAQDIADSGNAHAEEIDANLNSDAASQVACMLLSASLSLAVKGHMGLRREEVIEYLAAPNRKAEEFAQAFKQLKKTAWYLHAEGELFYFKDTENLTKRIQREAQGLPKAKVEKALRTRLEGELEAQSKKAYQEVLIMPEINEIRLGSHRILVVVPPDNSVPPEDIHRFYGSVAEKNNLLVLSGNDTHMASRVEESLRELYAIEKIAKNLKHSDSLYEQAQDSKEEAEGALLQALQGTYNRLFYPSEDELQQATIENGLKFGQTSDDSVETQIEAMLASMRCDNKLATDAEQDSLPYFAMAEEELWPQNDRRTPWRDVLMRAKSNPAWPWLPGLKGLDQLKVKALSQGRWREGNDGWIEKGPFPKEKTAVNIVSPTLDMQTGETVLTLTPRHAGPSPNVHYSTSPNVSEADHVVRDLDTFRTKDSTLYFLAVDSTGKYSIGEPKRWVAKLKIQHQVHNRPVHREVELAVTPNAQLRYTIDATNPREGKVYDGPFQISDDQILLQVYASAGEATATETFNISQKGIERPPIKDDMPAKLVRTKPRFDTTKAVFDVIAQFKDRQGVIFHGVTLNIGENEQAVQVRFNDRPVTPDILEKLIKALRESLNEPDALVQLTIRDGAAFDTGFDLKAFAELAGIELTPNSVEQ
ncbi:anti-phage-associated DUF499 domain-containing protein [Acaryochloris marina]|uniref:anti-phage-associated DUF499 domain-containing protein n=1 Tax=Acaryochloris marina TaxID=155978 RepID=UPI002017A837|nr:anti-phage-associated DUF499 domain-containing protein [Acaryochloris marina]QUY40678.1 DUF499 domain-containing protein [Acaryochloris marina S15]